MKGLSSTALANTTSLAQPRQSLSRVSSAVFLTMRPISATASILMPALVEPTLTLAQTISVEAMASGMERINFQSLLVAPFCTRAEKPPMKLTPQVFAAASNVLAIST